MSYNLYQLKKGSRLIRKDYTIYYGTVDYYIYEAEDGSIWAETLTAPYIHIAKTYSEYMFLDKQTLDKKIYCAEMSAAR